VPGLLHKERALQGSTAHSNKVHGIMSMEALSGLGGMGRNKHCRGHVEARAAQSGALASQRGRYR